MTLILSLSKSNRPNKGLLLTKKCGPNFFFGLYPVEPHRIFCQQSPNVRFSVKHIFLLSLLVLASCQLSNNHLPLGSGGYRLSSNRAGDFQLAFTGEIIEIGFSPGFWSGAAVACQPVRYRVLKVTEGTYSYSRITVFHYIIGPPTTSKKTPELNPDIFFLGNSLNLKAVLHQNQYFSSKHPDHHEQI